MRLIFSCILLLLFIFPTLQKESTIVLSNGQLRAPGEKVRLLPDLFCHMKQARQPTDS